jgi:hypothetical protein
MSETLTLTFAETGTDFVITDAEGAEVDVVGVAESEVWDPEAIDQALREAGFKRIGDWDRDDRTTHVVRI